MKKLLALTLVGSLLLMALPGAALAGDRHTASNVLAGVAIGAAAAVVGGVLLGALAPPVAYAPPPVAYTPPPPVVYAPPPVVYAQPTVVFEPPPVVVHREVVVHRDVVVHREAAARGQWNRGYEHDWRRR